MQLPSSDSKMEAECSCETLVSPASPHGVTTQKTNINIGKLCSINVTKLIMFVNNEVTNFKESGLSLKESHRSVNLSYIVTKLVQNIESSREQSTTIRALLVQRVQLHGTNRTILCGTWLL
jgi:hypothetical protein